MRLDMANAKSIKTVSAIASIFFLIHTNPLPSLYYLFRQIVPQFPVLLRSSQASRATNLAFIHEEPYQSFHQSTNHPYYQIRPRS